MSTISFALRPLLMITLIFIALTACSVPGSGQADYILSTGAGMPVPATLLDVEETGSSGTYRHRLVAREGALTLTAGSRYDHSLRLESYFDGVLGARTVWNDHGTYSDDNGVLSFASNTIQNLTFTGSRSLDSVIIDYDLYLQTGAHELVPLEYAR